MARKGDAVSERSTERIPLRRFGSTDLQASGFGLGCARIGGVFKSNPGDFVNLLSAALDGGINFFDTADMYSQGESEKLLGRAFRRRRDRVVIATKAGWVLPRQRQFVARIKPLVRPIVRLLRISRHQLPGAVRGSMVQDFSPGYLRDAIEGSLKRLRTDYIDLLQLHSPPADVIGTGAFLETLDALKQQGKIRYYGISCDTVDAAHAALRHAGVSSLQLPISLLEQRFTHLLPMARQQGVAVIARECLANGLLVKQLSLDDIRGYCQSDEEAADKARQLDALRQQAAADGSSLTQLALQYVSRHEGVSVALLGASRLEQIKSLLATLNG